MKAKKTLQVCFFGAYDTNFTSNRIIMDGLRSNGVKVVEVHTYVKMTQLDRNQDISSWKLLLRILRKYRLLVEICKHIDDIKRSDVIYIGFPGHFEVFPAYLVAKIFRKKLLFNPLVIFYTGFVDDQGILKRGSLLARVIKAAEKLVYTLPDIVLADTPYQKEHLMQEFDIADKKIDVLPIGADDKVYPYSPKVQKDGSFNVMYYGLYTPLHGVEYIVQAADILRNHKDIVFTMVGKGHTFEANYKRAQKLKLTNMHFYPNMMEDTAFATLAKGDVFLGFSQKHPTVDRAIPNKVYQGLALGKAVITADAKAIRSVFVDQKNIYLCRPADGKSLAKAILTLRNNPELTEKIAKQGYALYKNKFSPRMIGQELKEIIEGLLADK